MPRDKKIVNLGCGQKIMGGAINVDAIKFDGVDIVCDIRKGLPSELEGADEIIADYVLCQIDKQFKFVMNEIWRVLKPCGVLKLKVPNANYPCAFQDPMDCRYFVEETFDYFNQHHYRYKAFNYGFKPWNILVIQKERGDRLYVEMEKPNGT